MFIINNINYNMSQNSGNNGNKSRKRKITWNSHIKKYVIEIIDNKEDNKDDNKDKYKEIPDDKKVNNSLIPDDIAILNLSDNKNNEVINNDSINEFNEHNNDEKSINAFFTN